MSTKKKTIAKKEAPKKETPEKESEAAKIEETPELPTEETPEAPAPEETPDPTPPDPAPPAPKHHPVFILKWIPRSPYLGGRIYHLTPSQKKWAEKKGIARDPTNDELNNE